MRPAARPRRACPPTPTPPDARCMPHRQQPRRTTPMRIRDPIADNEEPYNLVPLTDMVFNLLIFFMCATTFAQVEKDLQVKLPEARPSFRPLSAPPQELIINVREDGSALVSGRTCEVAARPEL